VIAADGRPKSAWYGLARAWAPLAVAILDEGLNGLRVRIQNDRPSAVSGMLEVCLVRLDGTVIESQSRPLRVPPRRAFLTSVDHWLGGFVDSSYAYGFGPPGFDVAVARFRPDGGECEHEGAWDPVGLEAVHLPVARGRLPAEELGLRARWCDGWQGAEPATRVLVIETDRFAQTVAIDGGLGVPGDNFFHLVPGHPRRVVLRSDADGGANAGRLRVRALNGMETVELGLEEHPG
jgi:beta-mannosidase